MARSARQARQRPGRRGGRVTTLGPVLVGGLLVALLSGCGAPGAGSAGTDPAAGGFTGSGGVAAGAGARGSQITGERVPPAPVPSPAPGQPAPGQPAPTPPAVPDVPRQSADLAGQPAPASPPVRVQVESLGIDMSIEAVGLDGTAMALPANPAVAAWYRYGSAPHSPAGATVIAAHVDSLVYDLGPFARLADAPGGTEIVLTTADGATQRYAITAIDTVEKQSVPWAGVFDRAGQPRLTLVTCGGEFDYEAKRYLSNVLVSAVPVP
ncbi:class F sortase [Cryobacterium sp. 1639]|uniref:class F sortase n=1 Tax=Cryobacterium inferilacus TaxID=2866629 RepID=UPI001C73440A|nr:class F sortase [Cryobacterium sp. 1639]MBX0299853.1 class F sortase [Cryobacterium sp. 1639]